MAPPISNGDFYSRRKELFVLSGARPIQALLRLSIHDIAISLIGSKRILQGLVFQVLHIPLACTWSPN
jgi:hypothetical protein